jgi:hypothetical protein
MAEGGFVACTKLLLDADDATNQRGRQAKMLSTIDKGDEHGQSEPRKRGCVLVCLQAPERTHQ